MEVIHRAQHIWKQCESSTYSNNIFGNKKGPKTTYLETMVQYSCRSNPLNSTPPVSPVCNYLYADHSLRSLAVASLRSLTSRTTASRLFGFKPLLTHSRDYATTTTHQISSRPQPAGHLPSVVRKNRNQSHSRKGHHDFRRHPDRRP